MAINRFCISRLITRALILVIVVLSSLVPPPVAAKAPTGLDSSTRTRYFVVYFNKKQDFQAKLLAEMAQDELMRVSRDLNYTPDPDSPFPLRIYSSRKAFMDNEGLEGSKWTVGTTRSITETIAIDASGLLVAPKEVLAHEITHAIIFRMLDETIYELPLWFNEGLSQIESGGSQTRNDELVAEAAVNGTLLHLSGLETTFPSPLMDQAYAASSSAVRYMMEKYGKSSPKIVLHELARTGSFDKAMVKATGLTGSRFADDWYAHTTKRMWSLRVARAVTAAVSALMAALAIAAFFARRRRMAAAAKIWQQEEFEEALRRQQGNDWSIE